MPRSTAIPGRPGIHESIYCSGTRHQHQSTEERQSPGLDDIQTELIKQFGPKARDWLLRFFNNCTDTTKIPKIWRQAKVVALLKPGKDPSVAKSFRPISLLCHTYKLFERLILNRIAEHVDAKLIPEQAGFRPGKSCTSQLLNLTEHIEDGYEKRLITGSVFVDLSAAYDTVNHRLLLSKCCDMFSWTLLQVRHFRWTL